MSTKTIYDVHGIGMDATARIRTAIERASTALIRLRAQPPKPIPPIGKVDRPTVDHIATDSTKVTYDSFSDSYRLSAKMPNLNDSWSTGSIDSYVLDSTSPEKLLELTIAMEKVADQCERFADSYEDEIKSTIESALQHSDAAIRELATGIKTKNDVERDKIEWIEKHGSTRLRRMVQEGIKHTGVYFDERLTRDMPGWCWYQDARGTSSEAINVPRYTFDMLDESRKTAPDARLAYYTVEWDSDEYPDSDPEEKNQWQGYVAMAEFLGSKIVFGLPEEFWVS